MSAHVVLVYPRGTRFVRRAVVDDVVHLYDAETSPEHTRCGLAVNEASRFTRRRTQVVLRPLTCRMCLRRRKRGR